MLQIIRRLVVGLVLIACALLAWVAWNPVVNHDEIRTVKMMIPPPPEQKSQRWQVESRRMIRENDAQQIKRQLATRGLHPKVVASREQVQWTGFVDPYNYTSVAASMEAQARWQQKGIASTVLHDDEGYHLLLGRFFSSVEAEGQRQRLAATTLPWRDQSHTEMVVVWRLRFAPQAKKDAEITWRLAQQQGGVDPVMRRYGDDMLSVSAITADRYSAHRDRYSN